MKRNSSFFCVALFSLIALNVHAYEYEEDGYEYDPYDRLRGVLTLNFGWDWAQVMKSQDILLNSEDPEPDYFGGGSKTNSQPMAGAAVGIEFPISYVGSRWQMTVAYYQSATFEAHGIDYFYSLRNFGNRSFSYSVNSQRALFENKILFDLSEQLNGTNMYAYVMLGIGVAINKAYDYSEKQIQPQTPANGEFASHTQTSPSYAAGLGLEYEFAQTLRLGLGYRFLDLGKMSLGDYNNGDTDNTISNDNMLAQEAILQLTVLF